MDKTSSILIVGAGTWGCSTALHLARRGYSNVTVLDPYPVPSPISAGNDINKILDLNRESGSTEDERHVSKILYDVVMKGWTEDVVFSQYFHDTGMIIAASSPEGIEHVKAEEGCEGPEWSPLTSRKDFQACMPRGVLTGEFSWKWTPHTSLSVSLFLYDHCLLFHCHSSIVTLEITHRRQTGKAGRLREYLRSLSASDSSEYHHICTPVLCF